MATVIDNLLAEGAIGGVDGGDPLDWELWIEGDMLTLNLAVPGGGMYVVSAGLTMEQADRLGRALAGGVGLLISARHAMPVSDSPQGQVPS